MSLSFTGERYLPSEVGSIELEHVHRYLFALETVKDKVVLDIACGEGYGTNILGRVASKVYGVDIDQAAIDHATESYPAANLEFKKGECSDIPLADSSVDMIVSFETIEHLDQQEEMLTEFKRVMKDDGLLIISSPDKLEYSDLTGYSNPYHVKELYKDEFEALLGRYFLNHAMQGQRVVYGSILSAANSARQLSTITLGDGGEVDYTAGIRKEIYLVAVASDGDIPELCPSFYEKPVFESEVVQDLLLELSEYKGQVQQLGLQAQQLGLEVEQSGVKVEALTNQLAIVEHERDQIVSSRIWRWTGWMRKLW